MGQRLVIEAYEGEFDIIANCYYHWSAYTVSTLYKIADIIKNFSNISEEDKKDPLLYGYSLFAINDEDYDIVDKTNLTSGLKKVIRCAGLCDQSFRLMNLLFPEKKFQIGTNRNVGLIGIHPNDVKTSRDWMEGKATIDLGAKLFSIDVFNSLFEEEIEDYYYDGESQLDKDKVEFLPDDLDLYDWIPFDRIQEVINLFEKSHIWKMKIDEPDHEFIYIMPIE